MRRRRFLEAGVAATSALLLVLGGPLGGAAQDATPDAATPEPPAPVTVALQNVDGLLAGSLTFSEDEPGMVSITGNIIGLEPGDHGIHVHETGACDPSGEKPFSSAGAHFNPTDAKHGGPPEAADEAATPMASPVSGEAHAGDLGNVTVGDDGIGRFSITTDRFTISPGETSLADGDGSAVVVHADADDLKTDPSGNSGDRLVCGVIFPPGGDDSGTPSAGDGTAVATPES